MTHAIITTIEELEALPARSVVVVHFGDGSQPDFTAIRSSADSASYAGSDGVGIMGTIAWQRMIGWGATLIVEHDATV